MFLMYYFIISAASILSLLLLMKLNRRFDLDPYHVLNVYIVSLLAGLISARLFHVCYEAWSIYIKEPTLIFEFWYGGFVYYAGVIGGAFAAVIYLIWKKEPLEKYAALCIIPLSLATGLGRWACVFAGCCYGKYCELPWALGGRHPTAIYSFIWEMGILAVLFGLLQKNNIRILAPLWLILHGIGRLVIEQFRGDDRGPIYLLSISSWVSLFFITGGVIWLVFKKGQSDFTQVKTKL